MITDIKIKNYKIDTIIGIFKSERENKQPLFITLDLTYNATKAMITDDINFAFDYNVLTTRIKEYVESTQFNLIETLAEKILCLILENPAAIKASVNIKKPNALSKAEYVSAKASSTRKRLFLKKEPLTMSRQMSC